MNLLPILLALIEINSEGLPNKVFLGICKLCPEISGQDSVSTNCLSVDIKSHFAIIDYKNDFNTKALSDYDMKSVLTYILYIEHKSDSICIA